MKQERYILQDNTVREKREKLHICMEFLAECFLLAGVLGFLFCFISDGAGRVILTVMGMLSLGYLNVLKGIKISSVLFNFAPVILGGTSMLLFIAKVSRAFIYFCNQWIDIWNVRFDKAVNKFQIAGVDLPGRILVLLMLVLVGSVFIQNMVDKRQLVAGTIFVTVIEIIAAIFRLDISLQSVLFMTAGLIFLWLITTANQAVMSKILILAIPGICVMEICGTLLSGYSGNAFVESVGNSIRENTQRIRYGQDTLPQGDLTKAYNMVGKATEDALIISFDSAQKMYLKGFVGCNFENGVWSTIPYASYSDVDEQMMKWLADQKFESSFQFSRYHMYSDNQNTETESIHIENVGADRRYVYVPYRTMAMLAGNTKQNRDYQMNSIGIFGENKYSFDLLVDDTPTETIEQKEQDLTIDGANAYHECENVYRTFVYNNYRTMTEEEEKLIKETFFSEDGWENAGIYQITSQIRLVLQGIASYEDHPSAYSGSEEFTKWFLSGSHTGNAAYYATVATLAYREQGIPARYVEGYYLSASEASRLNTDGKTQATLTQADAHAWVEIYMDEVGWMPIEVVPGFYFADYTTQQIIDAPTTSVSIQNQTDEEKLQGSTTDHLDTTNPQQKEKTTLEKAAYIVGILMLIAGLVWILHLLVKIQYAVRRNMYTKKLKSADTMEVSRRRYQHVASVLQYGGIVAKSEYPYQNIPVITEKYPEIQEFECERFVQLLQKVVFGEMELTPAEMLTVQRFDERITEQVYLSLNIWKRMKVKYIYTLV